MRRVIPYSAPQRVLATASWIVALGGLAAQWLLVLSTTCCVHCSISGTFATAAQCVCLLPPTRALGTSDRHCLPCCSPMSSIAKPRAKHTHRSLIASTSPAQRSVGRLVCAATVNGCSSKTYPNAGGASCAAACAAHRSSITAAYWLHGPSNARMLTPQPLCIVSYSMLVATQYSIAARALWRRALWH